MSGDDAMRLGLAHSCVPEEAMQSEVQRLAERLAARPASMLAYSKARIRAAESLYQTNVREISGLLFSHFLQADRDEAHFWTQVRKSGVGGALDADKARLAAATKKAETA